MRFLCFSAACLLFLGAPGCGYRLRGGGNPTLRREGIQNVYIRPLKNKSALLGLETSLYSTLLQKLSAQRLVHIVNSEAEADAVLVGTVEQADMAGDAPTTSDLLPPLGTGRSDVIVFTQYRALLTCSFSLSRSNKGVSSPLWSSTFSRSKAFGANTQLASLGTTSHLINESELRRSIRELSEIMMAEVNDTMFDLF